MDFERLTVRLCLLVVGGVFALDVWAILKGSSVWLIKRLPDDAFYYLEIGQRIARGEGATFDGINQTNGFHPLWQLIVAVQATIFSGEALVRSVLITGVALSAIASWLLWRVLAGWVGKAPASVALLAAFHPMHSLWTYAEGLESSLVLFTLAGLTYWLTVMDFTNRRDGIVLGMLCGCAVLSRIDYVVVVPLVLIMIALWQRSVRLAMTGFCGFAFVVAPYFVWNLATFGHLLSVSGSVKMGWVTDSVESTHGGWFTWSYATSVIDRFAAGMSERIHDAPAYVLPIAALGATVVACRNRDLWRTRRIPRAAVACALVGALVAGKSAMDHVMMPDWAWLWYSVPVRFVLGAMVGCFTALAIKEIGSRRRFVGAVIAVLAGVAFLPSLHRFQLRPESAQLNPARWQDANFQAANWIRESGPEGRYGSTDAGLLGFYLDGEATVVNLDGLVNDYEYAHAARESGYDWVQMARREGVRYLTARVDPHEVACGRELWKSSDIAYGGAAGGYLPIRIWDLRDCPRAAAS